MELFCCILVIAAIIGGIMYEIWRGE